MFLLFVSALFNYFYVATISDADTVVETNNKSTETDVSFKIQKDPIYEPEEVQEEPRSVMLPIDQPTISDSVVIVEPVKKNAGFFRILS